MENYFKSQNGIWDAFKLEKGRAGRATEKNEIGNRDQIRHPENRMQAENETQIEEENQENLPLPIQEHLETEDLKTPPSEINQKIRERIRAQFKSE